jgi:hypothetical protein
VTAPLWVGIVPSNATGTHTRRRLAAELVCEVSEVPGDAPAGGCGFGAVPRPAFIGARNESGLKSLLVRALYVVYVACDEHDFLWR